MSWFKHDTDTAADYGYKKENPQQSSNGTSSFFTDPQSYNENSRALKARSVMKNEFKNDYLMHQQLVDKKREEKFESKRFTAEKAMEQQYNERRDLEEKQDEKLRKLEKQRFYQMQLQQQMQDNFDRKQAQRAKDFDDYNKYRSPFNSGVPQHQRDITNQEQLEALEQEKRNRKEKQDLYARQLSAQLTELNEKKMMEKYERRQPNPTSADGDSLDRLKREIEQYKRDYADTLQEHISTQNVAKQQQREKERTDAQQLTGLDIKGSYKFNGPTKQQLREDLLNQIQQKEAAKLREIGRNVYEKPTPATYGYSVEAKNQADQYGGGYKDDPYAGGYNDDPYAGGYKDDPYTGGYNENPYAGGYKEPVANNNAADYYANIIMPAKTSLAKENVVALDIFGNPTRQHQKPARQGGDFDIFGNPTKRR